MYGDQNISITKPYGNQNFRSANLIAIEKI
jgi:hypothetical protein